VAKLKSVLQQHGLQPSQIELELTERVLIDDGDYVRRSLNELNQLGVRISLDDFGTGYSALSYLTKFQIHTLKIDRSFVMRLTENDKLQQLVSSIIMMGQNSVCHCGRRSGNALSGTYFVRDGM
jgi:EAL domain-containing protein (putative c-di-GMP-specific phosphodiesterase class I)